MIYVLIPTTGERPKRLEKAIASIRRSVCDQEIDIRIDTNQREGYVKPVLRLVNDLNGLAMIMDDDAVVFPDTLQHLYNAYIKTFPEQDGICVPDNGFNEGGSLIGFHPFGHTKTFREIIYPGYFHNFVDREWTDIMKMRNKYCAVPEAKVFHDHYTRDPELKDDSYIFNQSTSDKDGALYQYRKANNFFQ